MSEGIVVGVTPASPAGDMYVTVNEMRSGTERYPSLVATEAVTDDVLTEFITDASNLLDEATGDHFLPTTGTIVVDGPVLDGFGRRGRLVLLPRRVRSVSAVSSIDPDGTTLEAYDADSYRVHSSLIDPATSDTPTFFGSKGFDGIEFLYPRHTDSVTFPGDVWYGGSFPAYSRAVAVTGTFDWATTPEDVRHATALIVMEWVQARRAPGRTTSMNTGRASLELNAEGFTGIPEVDRVIKRRKRPSLGLLPV